MEVVIRHTAVALRVRVHEVVTVEARHIQEVVVAAIAHQLRVWEIRVADSILMLNSLIYEKDYFGIGTHYWFDSGCASTKYIGNTLQ